MYKRPSGPVLISVIPRKPVARVTAATSFLLSATLSNRPEEDDDTILSLSNLSPVLFSLTSKKYRLPLVISPTNILFLYLSPSFDEFRKAMSVTPIDSNQLKTGSAYLEPGKLKSWDSVILLFRDIGPMTFFHPLLKPGLTTLISS